MRNGIGAVLRNSFSIRMRSILEAAVRATAHTGWKDLSRELGCLMKP